MPSDWESFKEAQRKYKESVKHSKDLLSGINDILNAWREHKIGVKDPRVRLVPLLLPSGKYTPSVEGALRPIFLALWRYLWWEATQGPSFSLGVHVTVFQAESLQF